MKAAQRGRHSGKREIRFGVYATVALAATLGGGNGAAAAAAPDTVVTGPSQQLEEITVTATRRSETALDAPIAISAYSGQELKNFGVESLQDLTKIDSSIQVTNFGATQQQIVIRGISSSIAATTGLYLDESPLQGGFQNNFRGDGTPGLRLIDVERVEVLKGPQGTLFGSGSMDGTLRVISNKPDLNHLGGSLTAEGAGVSNGNPYYDGNVVLNLPIISDTLAVRLVGWGETGGGYVDQTINGRTIENINNVNLLGGRATVLWQATKDFSLTASVNFQNSNVNGSQYWDLPIGPYNNNETSLSPYHDDYTLWNVTARYELPSAELLAIATHGRKRSQQPFDSTPTNCSFGLCPPVVPPLSFVPVLDFDDTTAELRFVSKFSGPVQLVVGGYYEKDHSVFQGSAVYDDANGYVGCYTVADCEARGLRNPGNNFTGVPANFLEFGTIDTTDIDQYAAYAQVDWKITDPLTLTIGARYFSATISDVAQSTQDIAPPNACNWVFGCVTVPYNTFDGSDRQNKTTYNLALLYKINPDLSLYARAASGFRIGGINTDYNPQNLPQIPLGFAPDSVWDYEAGIKTYFLDHRLYTDLTVYHLDWSDQHLNGVAEGAFSYTLNAGKTKTDGVELNVNYLATRGLTLNGAVSYNDARLAQDLPQAATDSGNGGNSGDPIPLTPKWVAAAGGTYEFPISARLRGFANASVNYRDHTQIGFNPTNTFYAELPSYTLADLKVGLRWEHLEVGAFVRNIGDKAAVAGLFKSVDATRVYSPYPRMIGLSFTGSF
jgi:iron complex outermembrane receptor protein